MKNVQFAAKVNGLPVLYIADVEEDIVLSESSATGYVSIFSLLFKFISFFTIRQQSRDDRAENLYDSNPTSSELLLF